MKAYLVFDKETEGEQCYCIIAETAREAKQIGWTNDIHDIFCDVDYIDVRVNLKKGDALGLPKGHINPLEGLKRVFLVGMMVLNVQNVRKKE